MTRSGERSAAATADDDSVSVRVLLALLVGVLAIAAFTGGLGSAAVGSNACGTGVVAGNGGYTYAGHQASYKGHGVRATIALTSAPAVEAGHVAGWVGVGGPGQGVNGEDAWIQVGVAAMPGLEPFIYAEVTRGGREPHFILVERGVRVGDARKLAVLEMAGRPGWWRVWVDGNPVTNPIRLRGSSGRWAPIATAESWDGGQGACNSFAYRFERVSVSYGGGGSWKPFVSAYSFLDGGYRLQALATAPAKQGVYTRRLSSSGDAPLPYAFLASS
jgi:hypothetical protein